MRARVFSTLLGLVALAAPSVVVAQRDAGPVVATEARAARANARATCLIAKHKRSND
jgi:hypothetical protein